MSGQSQPRGAGRGFGWWAGRVVLAAGALVLILAALFWLAGNVAKSNLIKQYPAPGRLVDVGGYKLHLNCSGEGSPTVLLDAGHAAFSVHWSEVQREVARFNRVCVYDRAGYGWSEPGTNPRTSETAVKELHTLLGNAGELPPYVLVGHSLGGLNMRLFAHHFPQEVAAMVLVDAVHEEQDMRLRDYSLAGERLARQLRLLSALRSLGMVALFPETVPNPGMPPEIFAQYAATMATSSFFETSNAETYAMAQSFDEFRSAVDGNLRDLPLIVLSRGQELPIPGLSAAENQQNEQTWRELQAELAALSRNSQQFIAEKSGHDIPLQQPELVVEVIRQLLTTLAAGPPSNQPVTAASVPSKPASVPTAAPTATAPPKPTPTPSPQPTEAAPLVEVTFTLHTAFEGGRMLFIGAGSDIEGVVSPDLVVAPGTRVQVILLNGDGIPHDITFPDFGAHSAKVSRKGKSVEVVFTVPADQAPGAYVYFCTLPGHREAGQEGWLMVEEG